MEKICTNYKILESPGILGWDHKSSYSYIPMYYMIPYNHINRSFDAVTPNRNH